MARRRTDGDRWECPDCEIVIVNGPRCPQCRKARGGTPRGQTPLLTPLESWKPDGPPPLTKAEAARVMAVIYAVIDQRCTPEQANARLAQIFATTGTA